MAVEFKKPEAAIREQIWESVLPRNLLPEGSVDIKSLAFEFELTGGLIKQAVKQGLSIAIAEKNERQAKLEASAGGEGAVEEEKEKSQLQLTTAILRTAARSQLRGKLRLNDLHRLK